MRILFTMIFTLLIACSPVGETNQPEEKSQHEPPDDGVKRPAYMPLQRGYTRLPPFEPTPPLQRGLTQPSPLSWEPAKFPERVDDPPPPAWQPARIPERDYASPPVRRSTVPQPASISKPPVQPSTVPAPAVVPQRPTPNRTGFTLSKSGPECPIDNVKQELLTAIIKADEHLKGSLIDGLTELDLEQVIANAVQRAKNCAYPGGEETALNRRLNLINMAKGMLRRPLDEPTLIKVESKLFEAILRLEKEGVDMRSVWGSEELAGYMPPFSL